MRSLFITDRVSIKARSCNRDQERLTPGRPAIAQAIPQAPVRLGVELVKYKPMPVQPLLPMVFSAQSFQEGIRAGYRQMLLAVPGKYLFFQERRPLRHSAGFPVDNRRLVSGRRRAVDLGARLTVSRHEIQRQAAAQSAFAILFGNLDICRPEPAQPGIFMDPAEERPYQLVFLPGHELYRLASPLPYRVM